MKLLGCAYVLVVSHLRLCDGFYLPGVAPKEFKDGEVVPVEVNKLTSVKTQLPFEYYSLPVCKPDKVNEVAENLGEVLAGDKIESSAYVLHMLKTVECQTLCTFTYNKEQVQMFQERIRDDYRVHWIIDNLPVAEQLSDDVEGPLEAYQDGFPVGFHMTDKGKTSSTYYLYNHIAFKIRYHQNKAAFEGSRVVGFIVDPLSVKHSRKSSGEVESCKSPGRFQQIMKENQKVTWTYSVEWIESDIPWASRWDIYLNGSPDDKIHWYSIINSLMIVLFLTGMVAMIMMRTLHKDIARYNEEQTSEEAQEEFGWKLVHGDVFRPPIHSPMLLSVLCGSGVQILAMTITLMVFALLGFLSPANRGGLMTAMILLFVLMGYFAGYVSSRMYKMFGGKQWKRCTVLTALLYPGIASVIFFVVNLFVWHTGSSGAVPFGTMFALLVLWFGVSFPLAAMGSFAGFKKEEIKNPARYNQIPRQVPDQPIYMHPTISILVGGILPFGAVFIELFFIMSSIWLHQVYYVFGFLSLVMIILVATCAEISIVLCYFQLCSEDYNWWWRSFMTSGSSALYLFLYSCLYFYTRLDLKFTASVIYFSYMWLISFSFFLMTGTVGFLACFW
eukprot:CAMPEP_0203757504 /NCGR_PEP_ID=MMETSP0098-20131031/10533_1 /ASSEMBLY_ACC=CAM_ASM_000208 /TAXON_ID=96639 /ORGANISM=" , Strain NY0313808BC1" /LENGTH=613 /DNA_ID=CAMNT_0050649721 /DNA_START=140 /DNA_END=1978 /DNA_ORIENTATION=-